MLVETTVAGVRAGLHRPLALVALPVLGALLATLLLRERPAATYTPRQRGLLFGARLLLVVLLVTAAAGPYTASTQQVRDDPQVTLLVDRSASTAVLENATEEFAAGVEAEGVPVRTRTVGGADRSPVGDAVAGSLSPDGTVVVVSDGRVTDGRSMLDAADVARTANASINAVSLAPARTEWAVALDGPAKTSTDVENTYRATVDGVALDGTATLTVTVDGEEVHRESVDGRTTVEFTHTFATNGSHRMTARLDAADTYDRNDVARTTVRAVDPPRLLYVGPNDAPFADFLEEVYRVDRAESVPDDLSGYYAVVVQDQPAGEVGNVSTLQRAVVNGTGLVTVGGPDAFENGGYRASPLIDVLPVTVGTGDDPARVVLAVDISGSTAGSLSVQQALAIDALGQLGDRTEVGVVAFTRQAYEVVEVTTVGGSRDQVAERIRRLESRGGTDVGAGIDGGRQLLGPEGGTVILFTDGRDRAGDATAAAAAAAQDGVRVIPVGVGERTDTETLLAVAEAGDGTFIPAGETDRLRIFFGGETREYAGDGLAVVDGSHFITRGVELASGLDESNSVAAADRADHLVAGPSGVPALTTWRYGLGRTAAVTAYDDDGTLGGLLAGKDSRVLTRTVNWAIGDPERLERGVTDVPDARVGAPVTVSYEGDQRPATDDPAFRQVGATRYEATVVPETAGYETVLDAEYAVNYPREYAAFGQSRTLATAVEQTGGEMYDPDDGAAAAAAAREAAVSVREVTREWTWLALALAVVVFLSDCTARRLHRIRTGT